MYYIEGIEGSTGGWPDCGMAIEEAEMLLARREAKTDG
jgi:hypothetical protein